MVLIIGYKRKKGYTKVSDLPHTTIQSVE